MRCPAVRANNSKTVSLMVQGCGGGNSSHTLTFLHGAVRLTISVISLPCELAYPNPETDVWFWSRPKGGLLALVAQLVLNCVLAGVHSQPMATVSQTLLSEDAKSISLGQFLQLMCNTQDLKVTKDSVD